MMRAFPRSHLFAGAGRRAAILSACLGLSCGLHLLSAVAFAQAAFAQEAPPKEAPEPKKEKHRNTPLDTIMNTHIWADVPESKDFVKERRPPPERMDYTPLTGTDPERPKLRSKPELQDLETELENARARNEKRGHIKPKQETATSAKSKPATETR